MINDIIAFFIPRRVINNAILRERITLATINNHHDRMIARIWMGR